jgi:hypothetical protein
MSLQQIADTLLLFSWKFIHWISSTLRFRRKKVHSFEAEEYRAENLKICFGLSATIPLLKAAYTFTPYFRPKDLLNITWRDHPSDRPFVRALSDAWKTTLSKLNPQSKILSSYEWAQFESLKIVGLRSMPTKTKLNMCSLSIFEFNCSCRVQHSKCKSVAQKD